MLHWEAREGEKGRFANGAKATYRIRVDRQAKLYYLAGRVALYGPYTLIGTYHRISAAKQAAQDHDSA